MTVGDVQIVRGCVYRVTAVDEHGDPTLVRVELPPVRGYLAPL